MRLSARVALILGPATALLLPGPGRPADDPPREAVEVHKIALKGELVMRFAISEDGSLAVSGAADGTVTLYDLKTGKSSHQLKGHDGTHNIDIHGKSAVFTTGPSRLVGGKVGLGDRANWFVHVWDLDTGQELDGLGRGGQPCEMAKFSPDGRKLLVAYLDKRLGLWDLETRKEVLRLEGHTGRIGSMAFTPDGKRALTGSWYGPDPAVRVWDLETGKEALKLDGHGGVAAVGVVPDGSLGVTCDRPVGTQTYQVRVWDLTTGRQLRRYPGEQFRTTADGRRLVVADGARLHVYDLLLNVESATCAGHRDTITGFDVSPDSARAVSCGRDDSVRLWDLATGKELHAFTKLEDSPLGVAFSGDGSRAIGHGLEKIRVWRLPK